MTIQLVETYEQQNPDYQYKSTANPKRVLTKPSKEARNDGYDNEDSDYILKVNDILGDEKEYQYRVIDLLGQGTFGQVVKCERVTTGELFSVKVIKNKVAYRAQSRMEVEILKQLKSKLDSDAQKHILTLHHTFTHKNHFCLVFELLSFNLYELIKQNQFRGLSINLVRVFTLQLLDTLVLLKEAKIIHCDLKPENILLTSIDTPIIKVIDFGSACHEANKIYTYIQSRFYRSPEILLGLSYTGSIDMWSLGCIIAELFIGIPLFPGSSEYNQLRRIVDMLGMPPQDMLEKGSNSHDFFNKEDAGNGKYMYSMKSLEQYGMEHNKAELPGKKYYAQTELPDLILNAKSTHQPTENIEYDLEQRHALIDLLQGLLEINPLKRWTPHQARHHPFVTGQPFTEPYNPDKYVHNKLSSTTSSSQLLNTINETQKLTSKENNQPLEKKAFTINGTSRNNNNNNGPTQTQRPRAQSMNAPTLPSQIHDLVLDMQAHPIIEHHPLQQINNTNIKTNNNNDNNNNNNNKNIVNNNNNNNNSLDNISAPSIGFYKHRHARSQGDLVGLLSPEHHNPSSHNIQNLGYQIQQQNSSTEDSHHTSSDDQIQKHTYMNNNNHILPTASTSASRKVKIAPKVKIRIGSRETYQQADVMHNDDSGSNSDHGSKLTSLNKNNGDWLVEPTLSSLHALSTKTKPKGHLSHQGEAAGGLLMMRLDKTDGSSISSSSSGKRGVTAAFKRRTLLG
ncbi:kinase-like domain-containing protein [Cunninghamella echinulata]|nr:kinase-like domain-containing protein [Cunninghamella echinulata]